MSPSTQAATGTAPGRLDFLGGVADYSGALVLETPIQATTRVELTRAPGEAFTVTDAAGTTFSADADLLADLADPALPYPEVRRRLDEAAAPAWTRYVLGCHLVLRRHGLLPAGEPLAFTIAGEVPQGMGVSSSAALEVATIRALADFFSIAFSDTQLAHLAREAENHVVGAPCGLMDQLTVAYAEPGSLLPILCRPDLLLPGVRLPEGARVAGWPSGVRHSVGDSPYLRARTATFMAFARFQARTGMRFSCPAEIPLSCFLAHAPGCLPRTLSGAAFLAEGLTAADSLSQVYPDTEYALYDALRFPVEEHYRANLTRRLLEGACDEPETNLRLAGELLFQSHHGYSGIGLGTARTDAMVEAIRALGPDEGFYGARTSGGGSGGTVVVLLEQRALPRLEALSREMPPEQGTPLPIIT